MRTIPHLGEKVTETYPASAIAEVGERIDAFAVNLVPIEKLAVAAVLRAKAEELESEEWKQRQHIIEEVIA